MLNKIIILFVTLNFNVTRAATLEGSVVGIADGDTITILDATKAQYKIRLAGIDAPEKKQDFGNVPKRSLSDMVFNQQVIVDWDKSDRYDRLVGKVLLNGKDVNLEQIRLGMAWYYHKYNNELVFDNRINYLQAEEDAINNRIGLWLHNQPVAPWYFEKVIGENNVQ